MIKSHPTHTYNFSQEGKIEGKVRLAYEVKTNFCQKIWKWSNIKIEKTRLTGGVEALFFEFQSSLKGQF